jgi:hypothetical protein
LPDVARIVYQEYVDGHYEGVLCEPNRIFPACNNPPILGLINFDQVHGTKYASDVMPKFAAAWVKRGYTNPVTKQNVRVVYVRQNTHEEPGTAVLDGWAGPWMHAWNPAFMETVYPAQRDRYVPRFLSGAYGRNAPATNKGMRSIGFGQVAFMAAEMGDRETRDKMLAYADRNFQPTWEEGAYFYPRNDNYEPDAAGNSHGVSSWTGNVLLALARLDQGSGFLKLYRTPWARAELDAPQLTDVDDMLVNVSQAFYDPAKRALIVTLKPGPVSAARVTFIVRNLEADARYTVVKDGHVVGQVSKLHPRAGDDIVWKPDGTVAVATTLVASHSFIFAAN